MRDNTNDNRTIKNTGTEGENRTEHENRTERDMEIEGLIRTKNDNGTEHNMLTGMFSDCESTEKAYNTLQERGYSKDDINLVMSEDTQEKYFSGDAKDTEIGTKAAESAGKGSAIGGTVGAIGGVIAAIGTTLAIPGLGIIIAGPIAAGLAGAGAGAITGGVIGALVGSGIPEARAELYESGIKKGQIVLGVRPRSDEDAKYLKNNWRENKGKEIQY